MLLLDLVLGRGSPPPRHASLASSGSGVPSPGRGGTVFPQTGDAEVLINTCSARTLQRSPGNQKWLAAAEWCAIRQECQVPPSWSSLRCRAAGQESRVSGCLQERKGKGGCVESAAKHALAGPGAPASAVTPRTSGPWFSEPGLLVLGSYELFFPQTSRSRTSREGVCCFLQNSKS